MTQLSLPHTLVAGTPENVNDVQANFAALSTWSTNIDETNLASTSGLFAAYRMLQTATGSSSAQNTAGSYYFNTTGKIQVSGGGGVELGQTAAAPLSFYIDDADYTMAGRTQRLRIRAQAQTGATSPGITYTAGLYPVSSTSGTGIYAVLGTVVAGSTVALAAPTASVPQQGSSTDFAVPADGYYVLGVALSATQASAASVGISVQLQLHWI